MSKFKDWKGEIVRVLDGMEARILKSEGKTPQQIAREVGRTKAEVAELLRSEPDMSLGAFTTLHAALGMRVNLSMTTLPGRMTQHPIVDAEDVQEARPKPKAKAAVAPRVAVKSVKRAPAKINRACRYPGCKLEGAPRYGMFCIAKHKDLPRKQKVRLRLDWNDKHAR